MSCGRCTKPISLTNQDKVSCGKCKNTFHLACISLTKTDLSFFRDRAGCCKPCVQERRSLSDDMPLFPNVNSPKGGLTLETIQVMKTEIIEQIGKPIDSCNNRVAELTDALNAQSEIIKCQKEIIRSLQCNNSQLQERVQLLNKHVEDLDRYGRRNTVGIEGMPYYEGENVANLVDLGRAWAVELNENCIDVYHRLRSGDVHAILDAKKTKDLTAKQVGAASDSRVCQTNATPPVDTIPSTSKNGAEMDYESESPLSSVDMMYDTDELRKDLRELRLIDGPITASTKRTYLRRLKRVRRKPMTVPPIQCEKEYSVELNRLLNTEQNLFDVWSHLEYEMMRPFVCPDPTKKWREGVAKTSFTYILLDPRITQDLPYRVCSMTRKQTLECFLQAIFYVGRGKRARPYSHFKDALEVWDNWKTTSAKKIKKIIEIWRTGLGIVCLVVFQNVIPTEAMTREAAMIDALGLVTLTNERVGDYYGVAATWNLRERQKLGTVLLIRALNVLLADGERQIRPSDVQKL